MSSEDDRPVLVGGPRDGARIAKGSRPNFIFVGGDERRPRAFVEPGPGRDAYRLLEVVGVPRFLFCGDTHMRCEGCSSDVVKRPQCVFCGHKAQSSASKM